MKTTYSVWVLAAIVVISLLSRPTTVAQPGYGQPGYGQPGYNQPGYGQPNYDPYNQYDQNYNQNYNQPDGSMPDFYDDLAPYGQWVQTPQYGTVWIPNAEPGFQPYSTNGHWVITEYGNTWVSDYAWGWGPFHYGRWYQDRYRGWAWIPGRDWGPAWVSWRSGGGYYGWAPLGPGFTGSVNMSANYWTFVPQVYITSPRLFSYCVPRPQVINVYQNTTIINNVYRANNRAYSYGPRREEIEYVTRQRVPVYRIENAGLPGRATFRDNTVGFYRPDQNRGNRNYGNAYPNDNAYPNNRGGGSAYPAGRPNGNSYPDGQPTGNVYPNAGRDYSRREYQPNADRSNSGAYQPDSRNDRGDGNQRYPQPGGQESPGGYQRRNPRYDPQAQPQPGELPQPSPSQTQPDQSVPQPSRQESFPQGQGQWGRGRRQDANGQNPQPETSQPAPDPPQPQRSGGYEQRQGGYEQRSQNPGQPQPTPGATPERRGGSRGPR